MSTPLPQVNKRIAELEALTRMLRDALQNVTDSNDLALERGQSIEHWRNSFSRKQARAALAATEEKEKA